MKKEREKTIPVNSESIKRAILTTGMTQTEVSRLLGLGGNYITSGLSTGRLPESVVERIAIFLRVPAETLFTEEEEEQQQTVNVPEDIAKDSTIQALILSVQQLQQTVAGMAEAMSNMADDIAVIRTQDKNYYAATLKLQEKTFNQVRYDPTKVK